MNNLPGPPSLPSPVELLAMIKNMIAEWEATAREHFAAHPPADQSTFEQHWPRVLTHFFLSETVRVAQALEVLSEGRQN